MTIQQIYDLALEMGIKADPRGEKVVQKLLAKTKTEYKELPEKKKEFFDLESLNNPYSDTRIYFGDPQTEVKTLLAGIDADATEILLADRLSEKARSAGHSTLRDESSGSDSKSSGQGQIDLVIGHHPEAHALAGLHDVMDLQVDVYGASGIPINVAHALMSERMIEIERRIHPLNHTQVVDTARLLNMPYLSLHTVWDNMGDQFMKQYLKGKEFDTVGDIIEDMMSIPEYIEAKKGKAGPMIVSGSEKSRPGRIVLLFTGGTDPSKEMFIEMAKAGFGTVIGMHMPEDAIKEMRKLHINVINAGHMSSDSIGANLFFDELEKQGIEIIPCSGFMRVRRTK